VQHANNRDAIRYDLIEDHIPSERKTSYARSQFLTTAAEHRLLEQEMELRVRIINEGVRSFDIVIGDLVPNLDQIIGSAGTR